MFIIYIVSCLVLVRGEAAKDEKDQFCTDPRTMNKHAAYTEWADAYSCTRHRCQPGGRNLAIYTVGCKRVEAPESAIECEEVVEDTNMQFPYCCVRLRCLVVVRGEVWTRVLGQPWETLPAAPWSHMYKMKKPPPVDDAQSKGMAAGPVYELSDASEAQKPPESSEPMMRSNKENRDKPTAHGAVPDVVIALTTNKDKKQDAVESGFKPRAASMEFDRSDQHESEGDEGPIPSEKDTTSDEGYPKNRVPRGHKSWTRVSQDQRASRAQPRVQESDPEYEKVDSPTFLEMSEEKAEDKPGLQSLVDAIGTRMRDIENVVQRMSEQVGPLDPEGNQDRVRARNPDEQAGKNLEAQVLGKRKRANPDMYNRVPSRPQGSSYLQSLTTEPPLFVEDANLHGYFSDPSNTMMRRSNLPKEPQETYMAPIDTSHKATTPESNEPSIKHKKRSHKKKKSKRGKKKHRRDGAEEKKFNKIAPDLENNVLSVEDSNDFGKA